MRDALRPGQPAQAGHTTRQTMNRGWHVLRPKVKTMPYPTRRLRRFVEMGTPGPVGVSVGTTDTHVTGLSCHPHRHGRSAGRYAPGPLPTRYTRARWHPTATHPHTGPDRTGPDRTGPDRTGPDRTGRLMPDRTIGSVNKRVTYEQNSAGHRWAATRSTSPASSGRACVPPATFPAESGSPRADPRRSPRPGRPRGWSRNPPGRADAPSIEHTHENQHPVRSPTPMP